MICCGGCHESVSTPLAGNSGESRTHARVQFRHQVKGGMFNLKICHVGVMNQDPFSFLFLFWVGNGRSEGFIPWVQRCQQSQSDYTQFPRDLPCRLRVICSYPCCSRRMARDSLQGLRRHFSCISISGRNFTTMYQPRDTNSQTTL
jgi:hypothetical protein